MAEEEFCQQRSCGCLRKIGTGVIIVECNLESSVRDPDFNYPFSFISFLLRHNVML